jgi:hypothetical protein
LFYGLVGAPDEAAAGKARLTLVFTGPKEWRVAPATVEIPVLAKAGSKIP